MRRLGAYSRLGRLGTLGDDLDEFFSVAADPVATYDYPAPDATVNGPTSGGSSIGNILSNVLTTARDVYGQVQAANAQQKIIDLNRERAARGLPPISGAALAPQVNVGVAPATLKPILVGAGIVAALYFGAQALRRR